MNYRILLQATVGLRPVQNYVHEAGKPIEFKTYMAATMELERLKKDSSPGTKFTIVGSKH